MNITRTIKLKRLNGELDGIDKFDSQFLRLFDILVEYNDDNNYISYKKPNDIFIMFAINLQVKIFWYDQDFIYWDVLECERFDDTEHRIINFLDKYLGLKEFKRQQPLPPFNCSDYRNFCRNI